MTNEEKNNRNFYQTIQDFQDQPENIKELNILITNLATALHIIERCQEKFENKGWRNFFSKKIQSFIRNIKNGLRDINKHSQILTTTEKNALGVQQGFCYTSEEYKQAKQNFDDLMRVWEAIVGYKEEDFNNIIEILPLLQGIKTKNQITLIKSNIMIINPQFKK